MTPRQIIGQRIRDARKARGMSQQRLADRIGITHSFIALIETGRCSVPTDRREAFAVSLGLSILELTELDGPTLEAAAGKFAAQHQYIVARELRRMAKAGVL